MTAPTDDAPGASPANATVLLADPAPETLLALRQALDAEPGLSVLVAADVDGALRTLRTHPVDLVVADRKLGGPGHVRFLEQARRLCPDAEQLVLGTGDLADTEEVLRRLGDQIRVLARPVADDRLRESVRELLAIRHLPMDEALLVRFGKVGLKQLERARRVQQRLDQPKGLGEILVELGTLTRDALDRIDRERRARMSLAELLVEDGYLNEENLAIYGAAQRRNPEASERELLVGGGLVSEGHFLRCQCAKHDIPFMEPELNTVDLKVLSRTSIRYLLRNHALPVAVVDGGLITLLADPLDRPLLTELARLFNMPIRPAGCTQDKIDEALRTLERLGGKESSGLNVQYREIESAADGHDTGEEAVQIVDYLLTRSIQLGASDLHIEPLEKKIRVRVRVDGVLQKLTDLPIDFAPRIVSRVKILAGADIAERRLHQDGKISVRVDGREVDIRVSSYVSVFGETLVMRLLHRNSGVPPLEKIGFQPRAFASLTEIVLEASSGLVLLVGPTGSGKTTTLYSFIQHSNDPGEKVITCEDPVEYVMDGLVQCSVNQKTGPTFAASLRAMVRQDPDTIVVGEIRDKETVDLALEAALTGHKVFSTFHTEESVGAFVRMLEMGAEPFLVASTVSAVIAQRLLRRLCVRCRKQGVPPASELRFLGIDRAELRGCRLWLPEGCADCGGTGYKGRLAIHEVLLPDDDFRDAVLRAGSSKELRASARRLPEFLTMQEDGVLKALAGQTSLTEVVANAPRDTSARPLATLKSIALQRANR